MNISLFVEANKLSYYYESATRKDADMLLADAAMGTFLLRKSQKENSIAASVNRGSRRVLHILIIQDKDGFGVNPEGWNNNALSLERYSSLEILIARMQVLGILTKALNKPTAGLNVDSIFTKDECVPTTMHCRPKTSLIPAASNEEADDKVAFQPSKNGSESCDPLKFAPQVAAVYGYNNQTNASDWNAISGTKNLASALLKAYPEQLGNQNVVNPSPSVDATNYSYYTSEANSKVDCNSNEQSQLKVDHLLVGKRVQGVDTTPCIERSESDNGISQSSTSTAAPKTIQNSTENKNSPLGAVLAFDPRMTKSLNNERLSSQSTDTASSYALYSSSIYNASDCEQQESLEEKVVDLASKGVKGVYINYKSGLEDADSDSDEGESKTEPKEANIEVKKVEPEENPILAERQSSTESTQISKCIHHMTREPEDMSLYADCTYEESSESSLKLSPVVVRALQKKGLANTRESVMAEILQDTEPFNPSSQESRDSPTTTHASKSEGQAVLKEEVVRSAKNQNDNEEANKCLVCIDSERQCAFVSCGHVATCLECASKLDSCPVCRSSIKDVIRVFL